MNRVLVRFLLWFFIAALPLQGYAGVLRMCCAPDAAMATSSLSAPGGGMVMARQAAAHCAGMVPAVHDAGRARDHAALAATGDASQPGAGHSCAACAACCLAAALLPSSTLRLGAVERKAGAVAPAPAVFLAGHIPAGPERPPRPFLC